MRENWIQCFLMKLLCSSPDLEELAELVKKLVWAYIPCAVCKDPINSQLSLWIQQDIDFPLALRIYAKRQAPRRLPHWACVFDPTLTATNAMKTPSVRFAGSKGLARTESGMSDGLRVRGATGRRTCPASWALPVLPR
jgi:hypothetical protein